MCGVKSDRTAALLWVAMQHTHTHAACWLQHVYLCPVSYLHQFYWPQDDASRLIPHASSTNLPHRQEQPQICQKMSRAREREREREGGKNSQVTITAGQYFMKMKCSGTVYTAARETQQARVKLLSAGVFLAQCVWRRGSGDAGSSRGPPGPSLISTERFPEKNPQFFFGITRRMGLSPPVVFHLLFPNLVSCLPRQHFKGS